MKKIVSILLALTLVLSLAACGGESSGSGNGGNGSQEAAGSSDAASSEAAEANTENTQTPKPEEPSEPEGTVALDNEYFKLSFIGIEEAEAPFFCKLLFNVENKGSKEGLDFYPGLLHLTINGFGLFENSWELDNIIASGESFGAGLYLYNSVMEAIGVDSIDKIEKVDISLSDWVSADGKYEHESFGECSIYPTGLEGSYVQKARASMTGDETAEGQNFDVTVYWKEGVDFVTALESGGQDSPVVIITNKTAEEYEFSCSDFRINGIKSEATQSGFGSVSGNIKSGGTLVGRVDDDSSYIDHYIKDKITKVDAITFEFSVYALSDHPYNRGDNLGRFNMTIQPEPIHN